MKKILYLSVIALGVLFQSCDKKEASTKDYKDSSLSIDERVEALLPLMSLEEKVAQMRIFHANIGVKHDENGNLKTVGKKENKIKSKAQ